MLLRWLPIQQAISSPYPVVFQAYDARLVRSWGHGLGEGSTVVACSLPVGAMHTMRGGHASA